MIDDEGSTGTGSSVWFLHFSSFDLKISAFPLVGEQSRMQCNAMQSMSVH
jgi:hypothetical protein